MMDALLGRCFARCTGDTGVVATRSSSSYYSAAAASSSSRSSRIKSRRGDSSIGFLRAPLLNTTELSYSRHLGLRSYRLRTISSSASAPSPPEVEDELVANHDIGTADPSRTVRVRFVLRKECLFGQQFLLVGDQPCMGLWDPSDAIPLEWSDGHIWKAELDLPVDKKILFKFILRGVSGDLLNWQPGPDRVLQTWEALNTIVVSEDWESADDQKVTEVPSAEEDAAAIMKSIDNVNDPSLMILGAAQETRESVVDADFAENSLLERNHEGDMILVPGLAPASAAAAAQNIGNASFGTEEETNNHKFVQLSAEEERTETPSVNLLEENLALSQASLDNSELTPDCDDVITNEETRQKQADCQPTDNIVEKDMQWGRRTLEQILLNLGFTTNSTETT